MADPREPAPMDTPTLPEQRGQTLPRLVAIMQRLLSPTGCPWDREQTLETLRPYVVEEAHEVVDAIDRNDAADLREELGDLLLQVVFQAELGRNFREWKRRLRLFKSMELLGAGMSVTATALELGYGSPSAFSFMFTREMGYSPKAYRAAPARVRQRSARSRVP